MRGQKSRKGEGAGVRTGFEGGQTPLYRRLPKISKPMKGHTKTEYLLVKIPMLNEFQDGEHIDSQSLAERGLLAPKRRTLLKVVGGDELEKKNLVVAAHAFTESARKMIEENGGQCVLMSPTRPITLAEDMKEKKQLVSMQRKALKERRLAAQQQSSE